MPSQNKFINEPKGQTSSSSVTSSLREKQSSPELTDLSAVISLADHMISGVSEGSLSDSGFRPNASFHPIREVHLSGEQCELTLTGHCVK